MESYDTPDVARTYLLENIVLFLGGEAKVTLLTGTELGSLLVKLLLPFLDRSNMFLPEGLQGDNKVVVSSVQHPISLILDGVDEASKLLETPSYDQLIISLIGSDTIKSKVDQMAGQTSLGLAQILGGGDQVLDFLDQLLDVGARPLQLLLMTMQTVPEIGNTEHLLLTRLIKYLQT